MKLISHRGNLNGPIKEKENHPDYILKALNSGFEVEIDVWHRDGEFWLGHDTPQYKTNIEFLKDNRLWCHAKELSSLEVMLRASVHCFWHQDDDFTLTSKGFIWTFPGQPVCSRSVLVSLEKNNLKPDCYGLCTDYVVEYR